MLRSAGCFPHGMHPPARHRLTPPRRSPTVITFEADALNVYPVAAPPRASYPRIRTTQAACCSRKAVDTLMNVSRFRLRQVVAPWFWCVRSQTFSTALSFLLRGASTLPPVSQRFPYLRYTVLLHSVTCRVLGLSLLSYRVLEGTMRKQPADSSFVEQVKRSSCSCVVPATASCPWYALPSLLRSPFSFAAG